MTIDEIEEILEHHIQIERNKHCTCGWRPTYKAGDKDMFPEYAQHRRHLAEALNIRFAL